MSDIRIKLTIQYNGAEFSGWQLQPKDITVQGEIERAMNILFKKDIRVNGSGRTDAGVHARGQIAHCDIPPRDLYRFMGSLNGITSKSVTITNIEEVNSDFNARFDATSRRYKYYLSEFNNPIFKEYTWAINRKLDLDYLNKISQYIVGENDYEAFSKTGSDVKHYKSIVNICRWYIENDLYVFEISAIRFLRGMVRGLVGTFLEFEAIKREQSDILDIMKSKDRSTAGKNAPANGLILEEVRYDIK